MRGVEATLSGAYVYPSPTAARPHTPLSVGGQSFSYDDNGSMTVGLGGRQMTYDGRNRPITVVEGGAAVTYTYGPDISVFGGLAAEKRDRAPDQDGR